MATWVSLLLIYPIGIWGQTPRPATQGQITPAAVSHPQPVLASDYGPPGSATLNLALAAMGPAGGTLVLLSGAWILNTSVTLPPTVNLEVKPQARIVFAAGGGLIIRGRFAAGNHPVFSWRAAGTLSFGPGSCDLYRPEWFGLLPTAAGTDNMAALDRLMAAVSPHSRIVFPPGRYHLQGQWNITRPCTITGKAVVLDFATPGPQQGLQLTSSQVSISGLEINGPQDASLVISQNGIAAAGRGAGQYISRISIRNCRIHRWGHCAIRLDFVSDFQVENCELADLNYCGIMGLSVSHGRLGHNRITNVSGNLRDVTYGVAISKHQGSNARFPRSENVMVKDNIIDGVGWSKQRGMGVGEGLDTHGGFKISFEGNTVRNCSRGIVLTPDMDASKTKLNAPEHCRIMNNTIVSPVTDGTANFGIRVSGVSALVRDLQPQIIGNSIVNHGNQGAEANGGIFLEETEGAVVSGNVLRHCSPSGITLNYANRDIVIRDNRIIDPWSKALTAAGIRVRGGDNQGLIGNNVVEVSAPGTKPPTGLIISSNPTNRFTLGANPSRVETGSQAR